MNAPVPKSIFLLALTIATLVVFPLSLRAVNRTSEIDVAAMWMEPLVRRWFVRWAYPDLDARQGFEASAEGAFGLEFLRADVGSDLAASENADFARDLWTLARASCSAGRLDRDSRDSSGLRRRPTRGRRRPCHPHPRPAESGIAGFYLFPILKRARGLGLEARGMHAARLVPQATQAQAPSPSQPPMKDLYVS